MYYCVFCDCDCVLPTLRMTQNFIVVYPKTKPRNTGTHPWWSGWILNRSDRRDAAAVVCRPLYLGSNSVTFKFCCASFIAHAHCYYQKYPIYQVQHMYIIILPLLCMSISRFVTWSDVHAALLTVNRSPYHLNYVCMYYHHIQPTMFQTQIYTQVHQQQR